MKQENIFIVTQGDYSDYHICGVFTSEELAQKFIDSFGIQKWDVMRIEEYSLNPLEIELRKGYIPFFVRMSKEGECIEITVEDSCYGYTINADEFGFDIKLNLYYHVFAKDEQHAIKIVNEKRGQLIAMDRWNKNTNL